MVRYSAFDDDETGSAKYGIQAPEPSDRETPRQWLPPSSTSMSIDSQYKREYQHPQLIKKHWLTNGTHVDLPEGQRTLGNITGRTYREAFPDLNLPQQSLQYTPSLSSDDSDAGGPENPIKDLSVSPKLVDGVAQASFQLLRRDITTCVESPVTCCASKSSMPCSGAPPRLRHPSRNPDFAFSQSTTTTQQPLRQSPCMTQSDPEEEDLTPEPMPADCSGIKSKAKKRPKSPRVRAFKCSKCLQEFTRNYDMLRHVKHIHSSKTEGTGDTLTCTCCGEHLSRKDAFMRHVKRIPYSCVRVAKKNQKPQPELSEEIYASRRNAMMAACTRQT